MSNFLDKATATTTNHRRNLGTNLTGTIWNKAYAQTEPFTLAEI